MFKHVIHGVSVTSVLDRRRANANGEYPVRIVVHFQREKKYYTTGKACSEEVWERMPATKTKEFIELRKEIQIVFELIKGHVVELLASDGFSLRNLDMSLRQGNGKTLGEFIKEKIAELRKAARIGTMESYISTLTNLKKFKGDDTPVDKVTVEWLKKFEEFMARSRSITTIGINMRNIRAIMNGAIKHGYVKQSQYPFGIGKYEIKTSEGVKKALSEDQIKKIKRFHCTNDTLMMFRDIWLFIYYCNGINIADLINLKYSSIVDGEIIFIREKTKRTTRNTKYIRATVTGDMQRIIDRWGNEPLPDSHIFNLVEHTDNPQLAMDRKKWFTKNFNQHLKMIAVAVGLDNLTSYVARHSYATVLKRNNVNIAFISESLGHTSLNTTQIYLDSFEKEERAKNAKLLEVTPNKNH
jgi:integrase